MLDPELVSVKFGCSFEIVCIHRNLPITDRPKLIVSVMWFFLVELCIFNELMRKLRRLPPEQGELVPAIALTGYDSRKDQEHALAAVIKFILPNQLSRKTWSMRLQPWFRDRLWKKYTAHATVRMCRFMGQRGAAGGSLPLRVWK